MSSINGINKQEMIILYNIYIDHASFVNTTKWITIIIIYVNGVKKRLLLVTNASMKSIFRMIDYVTLHSTYTNWLTSASYFV